MVTESPLEHLRDKPKEEKSAVAGGIAIAVIVVLVLGWAIMFVRRVQNSSQQLQVSTSTSGDFNPTSAEDAQRQLQGQYQAAPSIEVQSIMQEARTNTQQFVPQPQPYNTQGDVDQFMKSAY